MMILRLGGLTSLEKLDTISSLNNKKKTKRDISSLKNGYRYFAVIVKDHMESLILAQNERWRYA